MRRNTVSTMTSIVVGNRGLRVLLVCCKTPRSSETKSRSDFVDRKTFNVDCKSLCNCMELATPMKPVRGHKVSTVAGVNRAETTASHYK